MVDVIEDRNPGAATAEHPEKRLSAVAAALHAEWSAALGTPRPGIEGATTVMEWVARRAGELGHALAGRSISAEEHNDERFSMVLALRRFMDAGVDDTAARLISRAMHDLVVDSPPLPHPRYRFTYDWADQHVASWRRELAHLAGEPGVRGLEVGCFEGQSACWWLENVLTHPTSALTCVDQFGVPMGSIFLRFYERHFDHNIAASGEGHRVTKLTGLSQVVLRMLPASSFHFAYVDASHKVGDVLQDAVLSWGLLRPGGIAIFDDYGMFEDEAYGLQARAPRLALDPFVGILGRSAEVLRRDWQLVLRKV